MISLMMVQRTRKGKFLAAGVTSVRLFLMAREDVRLQVRKLSELLTTHLAFERLLARMHTLMHL